MGFAARLAPSEASSPGLPGEICDAWLLICPRGVRAHGVVRRVWRACGVVWPKGDIIDALRSATGVRAQVPRQARPIDHFRHLHYYTEGQGSSASRSSAAQSSGARMRTPPYSQDGRTRAMDPVEP